VKDWQTVLFLCTGNFYRRRYAEAWFNYHAPQSGLLWRAASRGFLPHLADMSLSPCACERLGEHDIPRSFTRRVPTRLSFADLTKANLVVAMLESEHRPMIRDQFPRREDRVCYWNIHDVDVESPHFTLPLTEAGVEKLIGQLLTGHGVGAGRDVMLASFNFRYYFDFLKQDGQNLAILGCHGSRESIFRSYD
jgi:protein-tyrosine phosphatase